VLPASAVGGSSSAPAAATPLPAAAAAAAAPGPAASQIPSGILTEAISNGKITWGFFIAIQVVVDAADAWISGLPAGPLQDRLAGGLLLVRYVLFGQAPGASQSVEWSR
jgi:hypothetical protein